MEGICHSIQCSHCHQGISQKDTENKVVRGELRGQITLCSPRTAYFSTECISGCLWRFGVQTRQQQVNHKLKTTRQTLLCLPLCCTSDMPEFETGIFRPSQNIGHFLVIFINLKQTAEDGPPGNPLV